MATLRWVDWYNNHRLFGPVEAPMSEVGKIGLDIAEHVFDAHGVDERGGALFSRKIIPTKLVDFFAV